MIHHRFGHRGCPFSLDARTSPIQTPIFACAAALSWCNGDVVLLTQTPGVSPMSVLTLSCEPKHKRDPARSIRIMSGGVNLTHALPSSISTHQHSARKMTTDRQVFEFERHENVLIITPNGPFMDFRDNDVRDGYNAAYRILTEPEVEHLIVDFTRMDYFGSTFVGILIRLSKKVRRDGGKAVLCNLSENMHQMMKSLMLLENNKVDFSWTSAENRDAALQQMSA
jgi:anti-anti-sigma factor